MTAWLESLTRLTFTSPILAWAAAALPIALWLRWRQGHPAIRFAPAVLLEDARLVGAEAPAWPRSGRTRWQTLPTMLQVLGLILAVVALARPVELSPLPVRKDGIDIVLCLDLSSSMAATDLDPKRTRLAVVQEAAERFIAARPDDRIGLVGFARFPDLRCPPTLDHRALDELLLEMQLVESDGAEDATGIGTAVARAAQVLAGGASKSKVVVLLTDGEENVSSADNPAEIAPLHAAQLCEEIGVRVYTIAAGMGRQGASGEWIPVDTSQVRGVAERTGGEFFEAKDAQALERVYATIDTLETVEIAQPRFRREDRFLPFLIAALVVWWIGRLLSSVGWRRLP